MRAVRIAASVARPARSVWRRVCGSAATRRSCPAFVRDVFVGGNAGLNVEATEAIEDNYFREVSPDELTNSSLQGMVRGLRKRYDDRFSDYFSPERWRSFNEEISGKLLGNRALGDPGREGPRGRPRLQTLARRPGRDRGRRRGRLGRRRVDRRRRQRSRDGEDQGPGRDRGDDRRARPEDAARSAG